MSLADQLQRARVMPVVTARDVAATVRLAETLAAGGMTSIEITLRTETALASIAAVKQALPDMLMAAGTVVSAEDFRRAVDAGADICVSPGISVELLEASTASGVALLPGVATASDIMLGLAHGVDIFKLFPAVAVGGTTLLKAFAGPFPRVRFCPTGGLNVDNFRDFLALPNVICCGGSWMVSDTLVHSGRWDDIEELVRAAMVV